ncbi:MAG: hypothetical protein GAK37_02862 [Pseudomonas sp.]|nr:MAG: hypothetical protein GAK37_02862 [Pseudomonas sp.]
MHVQQSLFRGWSAWTLQQGALALHIVPGVGGRLMSIEYQGIELCFINPALEGKLADEDPQAWARLCGDWTFPLWGGGKTWVGPEADWPGGCPQRDLDSGAYTVLHTWQDAASAGIELQSPVCRQSGLQVRRKIFMSAGLAAWTVEHTLVNTTAQPVSVGIWDVLMLRRPGHVAVEWAADIGEFRAIKGQGHLDDLAQQGFIASTAGHASVVCGQARQFKVGIAGTSGSLSVQLDLPEGRVRYWRKAAAPAQAVYAHGHPVEVFNAPDLPYFEVESHSPRVTLAADGSVSFSVVEGVDGVL